MPGSVTKNMPEKSRLPAHSSVSRDTGLENDPRGKITASREQTVKNPRTLKSLFGFPAASRAHEPSSATAQQVPSGPATLPDIIDIMPTEFICCMPPALS